MPHKNVHIGLNFAHKNVSGDWTRADLMDPVYVFLP